MNKEIPLSYLKTFQCDNGSKFKSDITKLQEEQNAEIKRETTKYKHSHTAFVENLNKMLPENLFKLQVIQELNDPEIVSSAWVKYLYELVDKMNDTETDMIEMNQKDAVKLEKVKLVKSDDYPPEKIYLVMDCINTYYNLERSMEIRRRELLIEYGVRIRIE